MAIRPSKVATAADEMVNRFWILGLGCSLVAGIAFAWYMAELSQPLNDDPSASSLFNALLAGAAAQILLGIAIIATGTKWGRLAAQQQEQRERVL